MDHNDDTPIHFPRVTGYRVAEGRRAVVVQAPTKPRHPLLMRIDEAVDEIAHRAQWLSGTSWRVIGGIATATAVACAAVVVSFGGHGEDARAATAASEISVQSIASAYPTGRDRILVGPDGSLRTALFRAAVAPGDVDRIVAETTQAGMGERIPAGRAIDLVFAGRTADDAYRAVQAVSFSPRMDLSITMARVDGQLVGRAVPVAVDHTPLRVYGTFGPDARASLVGAGLTAEDADEYLTVLAGHVDVRTLVQGDRFDAIVEQDVSAAGERRLGGLMYAGLYQSNGIDLKLSQWTLKGRLRWYDAEEAAQSHDNVQRPVPGVVSSNYGSRFHPILGYTRMHKGLDFKAGYGTPILAVQTGWVRSAGWNSGGYGNQVELTHGAGLATTYSHMSQVVARQGTLVKQGDVIGYVGATGLATGPHLHYELHQNGYAIDPTTVKFTVGPQLRGTDLAGYQARLNALLAVPVGHGAFRPTVLASRN
jgi:murein DD-endopeptidase MepM/ murein hydrolase activator NlpD